MTERGAARAAVLLIAISVPLAAISQEQDEPPRPYSHATYFQCDLSGQWLVDGIVDIVYAPVYNAAVEDETISA